MRVTEAPDFRVGIVVSPAGVPAGSASVWTQLHHPKRRGGPGKRMPVKPSADKGIHFCQNSVTSGFGLEDEGGREQEDEK